MLLALFGGSDLLLTLFGGGNLLLAFVPLEYVLSLDALSVLALVFRLVGHPLDKLPAEPETLLFEVVILVSDIAHSIFVPVPPEASVLLGPEFPRVCALSMSLVLPEFTLVLSAAIDPLKTALTMLLVSKPVPSVHDAAGPRVNTMPVDAIICELTIVEASIWASEDAVSMLPALHEVAKV